MMSHKKIQSQGNIPFSWEDKPGVSRMTTQQECPSDKGLQALSLESSTPPSPAPASRESNGLMRLSADEILKIPLPPCPSLRPPRRSNSAKGIIGWWQDDPFLVAYKECTKSSSKKSRSNAATGSSTVGSKSNRKSKFLFSCKNSCEIREDNFVRLSNLPPIPKDRIRTLGLR